VKQKRAYRYRFYPTVEQAKMLVRIFGCVRYVYNWALRLRMEAYRQRKQHLYYSDTSAALTVLKQQTEKAWLNEVSSVPLQQTLRHLDSAYRNFFEGRAGYPNFKSKRGVQSATFTRSSFQWDGTLLTLAKMNTPLDIHWSRHLPEGSIPSTVTVSKDTANRYFISILVDEEIQPLTLAPEAVGLDLGLKSMVILSTGETVGNPKFFVKDERKLARAQRRHARKKKGSKNREKARVKVARIHARIADRRRDFAHKLSTRIIRENQYVCAESLAIKNMVKNHTLAKSISDVGWGEFLCQLEYKAKWYGRTFIKINRWYPSSKQCFDCKYVLDDLDLGDRYWLCPACGVHHDRDVNAARNILAAGQAVAAVFVLH
jgi:putative transposase